MAQQPGEIPQQAEDEYEHDKLRETFALTVTLMLLFSHLKPFGPLSSTSNVLIQPVRDNSAVGEQHIKIQKARTNQNNKDPDNSSIAKKNNTKNTTAVG